MRFAVLSDIHGNLAALEAVVADLRRRGVQQVVNLGDSLSGPLLPWETAQFLMAQEWVHLAGNHERQVLHLKPADLKPADQGGVDHYTRAQLGAPELAWLASLAPRLAYGDEVLLCHGTPDSDVTYFLESVDSGGLRAASAADIAGRLGNVTASLVLCGHTHIARSVRSADTLIVNPGSVGLPAYDDDLPYHHLVENGSPDARYAIVERRAGQWHSELLTVPYDHQAMARLARLRQREDWAVALETGFMAPAPQS